MNFFSFNKATSENNKDHVIINFESDFDVRDKDDTLDDDNLSMRTSISSSILSKDSTISEIDDYDYESQIMTYWTDKNKYSVKVISNGKVVSFYRIFNLNNNKFSEILLFTIDITFIVDAIKMKYCNDQHLYRISFVNNNKEIEDIYLINFNVQETPKWIRLAMDLPERTALIVLESEPYDDRSIFVDLFPYLKDCRIKPYWTLNSSLEDKRIVNINYDFIICVGDECFNKYVNSIQKYENKETILKIKHCIIPNKDTNTITNSINVRNMNDALYGMLFGNAHKINLTKVELNDETSRNDNYCVGSVALSTFANEIYRRSELKMFDCLAKPLGSIINLLTYKTFIGSIIYDDNISKETITINENDNITGIWILKGSHFMGSSMINNIRLDDNELNLIILKNEMDIESVMDLFHRENYMLNNNITIIPVNSVEIYPVNRELIVLDGNIEHCYFANISKSNQYVNIYY